MKIGEYEQMMSWLTRPEAPTPIEPRENFAEGTRLTNEVFEKYIKKNKGKSYSEMAKDLTSKGYVPFQGSDVLSEKAIEARAFRLGLTGMATSQISDFKTILNEATDENRLAYKRGEIDADLLRKRVIGRRADQKRIGTLERIERSREYRERVKTDPSMEAQRESAKASRARFREKEYLEYGTPPRAETPKQFLFRDLFSIAQKSEKGDRLKLVKKFAKKDFKKENFYNDVEVLDTKTGKKFNFKNIEKYINPKNTGYSFKDVIKPYEQKVFLNEKGVRNEINSKMIPGWNTGLRDNYFEVQHVEGRFKNPFNVHISPKASNAREGVVRARFDKNWEKAKTLSDKKEVFKEYTDNLPRAIASQPGMITRPREFGERVPFDQLLRETKQSGVKLPRGILKDAVRFNSNPMADPGLIKQGLKDMGKFGKYAGQIALTTPAGAVLATKGLGGTFDPRTTEGRLTAGAEAAFAPGLVKGTEAFTKNKILQRVLNLGLSPKMAMRAARIASPIGIATLLGEGAYQGGKYMLERKKLLESLTDEQRDDLLSRERSEAIQQNRRGDPEAFSGIMAANGGLISRQGFAEGGDPKDPKMNRRTFMKVMGGLASIPILGKFIKPAAKVVESAAPVVKETLAGAPDHFISLYNLIKKLGKDAKYTLKDREIVTELDDYVLSENLVTGEKIIQRNKMDDNLKYDSSEYFGTPVQEEVYMSYTPGKGQMDETMKGKTPPNEYIEDTALVRNDKPARGEIADTFDGIPDDVLEDIKKYTYDK